MKTPDDLKFVVKEKYGAIASQNEKCCCGSSSSYSIFSESYSHLKGYTAEADLSLGCGVPTAFAKIKEGDTVVDLGSGAGNDCFVARAITGSKGKVIGIDMTEEMLERANQNLSKLPFENVYFLLGDIENIPLDKDLADVVISNCVLNLVPDKLKAFSEIFRILKPGGHFSVSDIVLEGELPDSIRSAAELYAGCVGGAIQKPAYLEMISQSGFKNILVQKNRKLELPDELLLKHISKEELRAFHMLDTGIYSITVYAEKN
ncbi:MAG: arsenite methyltransferase [Bacteroidales bacterium]|jgi:ubiquinone/menaquinone biosynthesis C-methylase UbiE|nr:arsenite methyltransferase [Bacteroidales bacterium]MDN5348666.1 arsenite methyltransferase [Bacteroidales bacterium]